MDNPLMSRKMILTGDFTATHSTMAAKGNLEFKSLANEEDN